MQNRTFGPYFAAMHRVFCLHEALAATSGKPDSNRKAGSRCTQVKGTDRQAAVAGAAGSRAAQHQPEESHACMAIKTETDIFCMQLLFLQAGHRR
jgi:hypothetical protein